MPKETKMINEKKIEIKFTENNIEKLFDELFFDNTELKELYEIYSIEKHPENGITNYCDIEQISYYVVSKIINEQTQNLDKLFDKIENILNSCDNYVENLIVVGLFEGIQNLGKVEYHFGFNKWLKPISKLKWDKLIDFWEGEDWRKSKKV
jgi:hypothetical protein